MVFQGKLRYQLVIFFQFSIAWLVNISYSGAGSSLPYVGNKQVMWIYMFFFDQHHQPGKITSQVSFLIIGHLVAVSFELWMVSHVLYF